MAKIKDLSNNKIIEVKDKERIERLSALKVMKK